MSSFSDIGIIVDELKSGNQKTTCPKCSKNRTKKNDPCLSANVTEGIFLCHHCGWKGSIKSTKKSSNGSSKQSIVAIYDYPNESEKLLYQSVRFHPKSFSHRRPDGNGGWIWDLDNVRRIPYRLPELISSSGIIYIPGGEKDVENLVKHNLTSTTNSGGEGNWKPEFNKYLQGRVVVVLEDNDDKGRKHGRVISKSLFGTASSIKIIRFEEMPNGNDVSDYLIDHTIENLLEKVNKTPLFTGSYSEYFGETKSETDKDYSESQNDCDDDKTQTQLLIDFTPGWELFRTPDGELFITFPREGHEETRPIKSKEIRLLLISLFFHQYGKPPSTQALTDTRSLLEAKAQYGNNEHPVFIRIADLNGNLYLDLCNSHWEVVEITPCGWTIIPNPPVKFIRSSSMKELPHPMQGGSAKLLRPFLNLDQDQWKLVVGFLIACLRTKGPFPILCVQGEQGSGKSFFCRLIKSLIDPSKALLKTLPTNERDLVITAKNNWILAFDNLSGLKPGTSDALCRLSTGGGLAIRELYTNDDEIVFDSQRGQVLNGIDDIATRADLRDRALVINLPVIPKEERKDEESILNKFYESSPSILGGLLDGVSAALKNIKSVHLESLPRMADFAKWVTAAEPGLGWDPESFMDAYQKNRSSSIEIGLESDPIAQALIDLIQDVGDWIGTSTELLEALEHKVSEKIVRSKQWPQAANQLSKRLNRLAPVLREVGLNVELGINKEKRRRLIKINQNKENT
ncbi:MAG: hypothetical protein HOB32_06920, partial [Nitrospina sp.]|nr:hypothetical protein [Nitrospina sp.]